MGLLMHWDILDLRRQTLLKDLIRNISLPEYYMAGGTALSLQMKLRKSVDFDFFVRDAFSSTELCGQLCELAPDNNITVINITKGSCNVSLHGIQVSFFHYPYTMLEPFVKADGLPELNLASPRDIAVMKALAIGGRGEKKDFFDLYFIMTQKKLSTANLVDGLFRKCGRNYDFSYVSMGLNYFADAESEILPDTFIDYNWNEIKQYFTDLQPQFEQELKRKAADW